MSADAATNPWKGLVIATVFFGANDAVSAGDRQHVPVEEYRQNITSIVKHIRAAAEPVVAIILVTPPVVDSAQWPSRSIDNARVYADAVRSVAVEENTHLLDLWVPSPAGGMNLSDLRDGLHFGETGNYKMSEALKTLIRSDLPQLCPENEDMFQMHFPTHGVLGDAKFGPDEEGEASHYTDLISSWTWSKE